MQRRALLHAAPALAIAPSASSRAQTAFPGDKPIRYIVPVVAGGGSDLVGRTVTERWVRALDPMPMSAEAFGKYHEQDIARWTALVKAQNLKIES